MVRLTHTMRDGCIAIVHMSDWIVPARRRNTVVNPQIPTGADALSHVADAFRLKGTLSAVVGKSESWGYRAPGGDHVGLLAVTRGRLLFALEGGETIELAGGDVVAMTRGDAFTVRSADGVECVAFCDTMARTVLASHGGPHAATEFVAMRCDLAGGFSNPLRQALPPLIHAAGSDGRVARWLEPTVRLIAAESTSDSPGRTSVLNRLAEIVFVQLVRAWAEELPEGQGGWLRALNDPSLAAALEAIHARPGESWTVESLAAHAGLSRSAFAAKFRGTVGETPLEYLTRWRVLQAKELIADRAVPLKQVASSLGYASDAAFRTVFKRAVGVTPGEYRVKSAAVEG